jgi:hypothetical protein
MSGHNFTPKKIGKEFPKTRQGKNTKYFTEGTASLLNANMGDVFLIAHIENIGKAQKVMAKGNTLRNSARLFQLKYNTENPDTQFEYAVRQSVKDGGYVKVFAKITERN